MAKEITIYEAFDGSRFDSLHEANNYEVNLRNQAITALCNHDYDGWEDYIFTKSTETSWKRNSVTKPPKSCRTKEG